MTVSAHLQVIATLSILNTGRDINNLPLPSSLIDQYEIGLKKNLWKNTLAFNITAYQIENSNLAQTAVLDKNGNINGDTNIKEMTGATRSRGIELDITGNPTPNLSINAGYAYNNMVYTDTPDSDGKFCRRRKIGKNTCKYCECFYLLYLTKICKRIKIRIHRILHRRKIGWLE